MRVHIKPPLWYLGIVLLFFSSVPALNAQGNDPAGSFLRGYTEFQNAERLEASGDYAQALPKYRFAASIMEQISRENPEWQPLVVQYRLRKIVEAINRVESLDSSSLLPPTTSGGTNLEGDLPRFEPGERSAFPSAPPAVDRSAPQENPTIPGARNSRELQQLRQENQQLREQLNQRTAELKSALHEVDKTRVTVVELRHELAQARTRLDDALKDQSSVEEIRKSFARQLAEIADEFEKTRAERDVLEEENQVLVEKLEQAAAYIAASDEIREQLESERRTFFEEREVARADRDKVQGELETTLAELQESRAKLSEIEILTSENQALRAQTEEATAALAAMEEKAKLSEEALESLRQELSEQTGGDEELVKAREELAKLRQEIEEQAQAVQDLETLRATVVSLEEQLANAQNADSAELSQQEKQLREQLTSALAEKTALEQKIQALTDENPDRVGEAELTVQLAAAQQKIEELTGAQEEVKVLTQKLQEAEERLAEAPSTESTNADQENLIMALQSEVNTVNDRLFSLRAELSARDGRIQMLEEQLDQTAAELTELRLNAASEPSAKEAIVENELLRNILLRELREQARRQQARRLIEEEIEALQIQSETLVENLSVLGKGIELTEEEQSLFRIPVALIEAGEPDSMEVSIAITKPSQDGEDSANGFVAQDGSDEESTQPAEEKKPAPAGIEALTSAARDVAAKAQRSFEEGNLEEAEQKFFTLAEEFPENYYLLSQLAATQFQAGKTRAAEIALNRALALNPDDAFALSILGVVYFRQGKLTEAQDALRRSAELEPDKARTYNYLGIVASQKGNLEEAEQFMQKALELDPRYAEAHFNLAVIYATQEPPSIELARKHYFSATSLGAEPDLAMERLLQ